MKLKIFLKKKRFFSFRNLTCSVLKKVYINKFLLVEDDKDFVWLEVKLKKKKQIINYLYVAHNLLKCLISFFIVNLAICNEMSSQWQRYVDNMMNTKHMNHVGIFGLDGSPWSSSPNFPVKYYISSSNSSS